MVEISSNIYFKINFKCSAQKLELKWTLIQDGCQYYEKKFQIANKKKTAEIWKSNWAITDSWEPLVFVLKITVNEIQICIMDHEIKKNPETFRWCATCILLIKFFKVYEDYYARTYWKHKIIQVLSHTREVVFICELLLSFPLYFKYTFYNMYCINRIVDWKWDYFYY